jgi:OOP family OmpA-OmpF porin
MRHPEKWWIGLPILAVLVYFAAGALERDIESDLARRVGARVSGSPAIDKPQVLVKGRDVTVMGVALSLEEKGKTLAQVRREEGVRALVDATAAVGVAMPFVLTLERKGALVTMSGNMPVTGAREALQAAIRLLGLEAADQTSFAAGAPANFLELAQFAARRLAELDPGKATLSDASLAIAGEARGDADYEKALAAVNAPPAGGRIASAEIAPPRVSPFVFSAANGGGMIALSGHIPSNDLRAAIVERAAAIGAGAAVSDATHAAAGAPAGDFAAAAAFALTELGKLDQGKVALIDAKVTIEGQGRENVDAATITADAKAHLPQGFELARVDVAAGPISPYVFSAHSREGALTLSGHVPDSAAREKIIEAAKRLFFRAAVTDNLAIAKGAPKQFVEGATAALRSLARLAEGRLALSGGEVSLEGAALYQKAVADIEERLAASMPRGFTSSARLFARTAGSPLDAARCQAGFAEILSRASLSFGPDDAAVSADSAPVADALAALVLRCQDRIIEVAAHTDSFGIAEVNRDVSKRRARAVVDHLVKAGADAFRVTAVGHGGEQPIAPNDSEDNRARNRRIEFVVK